MTNPIHLWTGCGLEMKLCFLKSCYRDVIHFLPNGQDDLGNVLVELQTLSKNIMMGSIAKQLSNTGKTLLRLDFPGGRRTGEHGVVGPRTQFLALFAPSASHRRDVWVGLMRRPQRTLLPQTAENIRQHLYYTGEQSVQ